MLTVSRALAAYPRVVSIRGKTPPLAGIRGDVAAKLRQRLESVLDENGKAVLSMDTKGRLRWKRQFHHPPVQHCRGAGAKNESGRWMENIAVARHATLECSKPLLW